jgi:hypothetical protein
VTLPWRSAAVILDQSDEAVAARQSVLDEVREGIRALRPAATPEGSAFALHSLEDHLSFGHGLLDALRGEPKDVLRRAAGLFVVHEVYHVAQGLLSTNFASIGRAGVSIEGTRPESEESAHGQGCSPC